MAVFIKALIRYTLAIFVAEVFDLRLVFYRGFYMTFKKKFFSVFILLFALLNSFAEANQSDLKPFDAGSYQKILTNNANKPFLFIIWSITCSSCLKEMPLIGAIHQKNPQLKIIMLAADDISEVDQIQAILKKNSLSDVESWSYASENTQKLQFEIDPKWYGELPRTYFFDKKHQRDGMSGVLSELDYNAKLAQILK
jgi:thiol-disulfide isomerase/thioredoxin